MPVLNMAAVDIGFEFEWQPDGGRLFATKVGTKAHEQIAAKITSPDMAQLAATLWSRGYRSRAREITRDPKVKHLHMMAEGGAVGADLA